ncbi:hypothetical protein K0T92_08085 [Paenibacillus oenotherae]|uniref:Uncharacterized protein n=1 Tax=Paenibacillus oenotherae TaxID=1435645 RepID=A0ABS7D572_9BACL|nr:hypothetical protein [Paenibacillus oenotherae]MBW7474702.1 hypothetical protein [Paenibacillus oenotherae]
MIEVIYISNNWKVIEGKETTKSAAFHLSILFHESEVFTISTILPMVTPPIHGLLHYGYQLAMTMSNGDHNDWVFSNFIQLYSDYNSEGFDFRVDFYAPEGKYGLKYPGLKGYMINYQVNSEMKDNIIDYIMNCIDDKCYCEIHLNEYYLPNKEFYKIKNYNHQNLVYGYDKENKLFKALGFNKLGVFDNLDIGFEDFQLAYQNTEPEPYLTLNRYDIGFYLHCYKHDLELNVDKIYQSLEDYRQSKNSFKVLYHPSEAVFGLNVYDHIFEKATSASVVLKDIRIIHVLWEHKKMMLLRIKHLTNKQVIRDGESIYNEYAKVERKLLAIRNKHLKVLMKLHTGKASESAVDLELVENLKELFTVKKMEEEVVDKLLLSFEVVYA